jgi:SulP family sulfate permease
VPNLIRVLKLGKYITLIPYTVISGFMSGIGIIIILIELGPLLGHPNADTVIHSFQLFPDYIQTANPAAVGLSLLTLVIVFGTPRRINRVLPAPLLALVLVTLLSVIVLPTDGVLRIGTIPTGLPFIHWPSFQLDQLKTMVGYGIMLGVLGAIDSLLTSLVADNITQTQHDSDRELIGQGIGNCLSGLFGGLPGAGATMRTVINVKSGGRTPLSGVIHALVLLVVVLGAGPLTAVIPQPVLAGILLKVGIDIIDWSFLKRAHKLSLKAAGLMYGVMALTVFVDLITAVAVGVFIANLLTVKHLTELQLEGIVKIDDPTDGLLLNPEEKELMRQAKGRILLFHLGGPMSFGAAKGISQRLSIVGNYDALILDLTDVPLIGVTASLAIENMVKEARDKRRDVFLVGAHGRVEERLQRLDILKILSQGSFAITRLDALQLGLDLIQSRYQERETVIR